MEIYGLIGKSLGHSFSKNYFTAKFSQLQFDDYSYENFEMDSLTGLIDLIREKEIKGLNVTIPYKEKVIPYLDSLDDVAKKIGAVNTIKIERTNGNLLLTGYNTDALGFRKSIKPFLNTDHQRALILGNGGAAKAIKYVLEEYNIPYNIVTRSPENNYEISWDKVNEFVIKHHRFIINTTPLGTFPKVDEKPEIPYGELTSKHFLFDLTYNPLETEFMKFGKANGALAINGMSMLKHQADASWKIWLGIDGE